MAKTHFKEVSASKVTVEDQPGQAAQASSLGAATISTLSLGSGNAVAVGAAVASTHTVTINVNGTNYKFLVSNV